MPESVAWRSRARHSSSLLTRPGCFSPADGWRQEGALRPPAARAALAALAQLHSYFWAGSTFWQRGGEAAAELRAAVWPAGGYGQPSMQPADQFEQLAQKCAAHVASLGEEFAS